MKKKKFTAFYSAILTAVMGSFLLSGCGSTASPKEAVSGKNGSGTFKVGIVQYMDHASLNQITESIEAELDSKAASLGVSFSYQDYFINGQGDASLISQGLSRLRDEKVDAVVAIATPAALTAQSVFEGTGIPVIFAAVTDPVGSGLLSDLSASGTNITGTSDALNTAAILDLIFARDPDADRIGLLYSPGEDSSLRSIQDAKDYLKKKGVSFIEKTGTNTDEISMAADALIAEGADAVFTPIDNTVMNAELSICEKLASSGIPHYTGADSFALNGAFAGMGINYTELGIRTADIVSDILAEGKDVSSYPVVTMQDGILTLNTDTAGILGYDLEEVRKVLQPLCSSIRETGTAENFH